MTQRSAFLQRFARNKPAVAGVLVLVVVLMAAVFAELLFPLSPWDMVGDPFVWLGKSSEFPLGTDMMGRDLAAGLFYGSRISLIIGTVATLVAVLIGLTVGAASGYFGGRADYILMRITELFQTIPPFIFAIVLVAILQPSVQTIVIAIALVSWPAVARLVRAEFMTLREREFVHAAISMGMSDLRIIITQILPNALPAIIVTGSLNVATAILLEGGLAFLGLGDPNVMSWGTIIGAGRDALRSAWYIATLPGIAILCTVLAINLVGEGLNDALNPRMRNR